MQKGGAITLPHFTPATDTLTLFGYASGEVASALARETVVGGSASLQLSDSTHITFMHVSDPSAAMRQSVS